MDTTLIMKKCMEKRISTIKNITFKDYLLSILLILLFITVVFTVYQLWWPVEPVKITGITLLSSDGITPSSKVVKRGETMYFIFDGQKLLPVPVRVSIELVNGERMAIMTYDSNTPVGYVFKKRSFIIPYHIQPGRYRLVWTGNYFINSLRVEMRTVQSDWITIL